MRDIQGVDAKGETTKCAQGRQTRLSYPCSGILDD